MSRSPRDSRSPSRFAPQFFSSKRRSVPVASRSRPNSNVSYLSTDFEEADGPVMPMSPSEVPIECSGYLHKHGRIFRGWKSRYFELQGPHLFYYKDGTKSKCLGVIDLNLCADVKPSQLASFGNAFDIITTKRIHTLAARTEEDMKQWMSFIDVHMSAVELPEKKSAKKLPHRTMSEDVPTPNSDRPVKRGKSFIERLRHSLHRPGRIRSPPPDSENVPPAITVTQAKSEDNLLSPTERAPSPLATAYKSTPVSREASPKPSDVVSTTTVEISNELQQYYGQRFVFDEVKEFLATRADSEAAAPSSDAFEDLDPEKNVWMKEDSAIEQLRGFLSTCP